MLDCTADLDVRAPQANAYAKRWIGSVVWCRSVFRMGGMISPIQKPAYSPPDHLASLICPIPVQAERGRERPRWITAGSRIPGTGRL